MQHPRPGLGENITYWEDNPKNAGPSWVNWFTGNRNTPQVFLRHPEVGEEKKGDSQRVTAVFRYRYSYSAPPKDLIYRATAKGIMNLRVRLLRPDGKELGLLDKVYVLNSETDLRIPLGKEAVNRALEFAQPYQKGALTTATRETLRSMSVFFAQARPGMLQRPVPLRGPYEIKVTAVLVGKDAFLRGQQLVVAGDVFGLLGTDSWGRDIWSGAIAGVKWALLIGLVTAAVSVAVGVLYGVASAYFGGWVDALLMRIYDVFQSIPFLPVLIVVSAVFKPSFWVLIFMMCLFFWVGPVRTVRSIGLQLREETYVEAARALGASGRRIIFQHMIPQLVPYAFASMALAVPGAVVSEATVSLIGLGDATVVTWGQILHDAMANGAALQGMWWWIVPPGLLIALMGMTFAFVGFAMDTILNPKLRTR
ncbi:MAG: ABC transporter permease [Firmicutes bacterium]|nr:ABC transporter permease [Bacillota bacterium]